MLGRDCSRAHLALLSRALPPPLHYQTCCVDGAFILPRGLACKGVLASLLRRSTKSRRSLARRLLPPGHSHPSTPGWPLALIRASQGEVWASGWATAAAAGAVVRARGTGSRRRLVLPHPRVRVRWPLANLTVSNTPRPPPCRQMGACASKVQALREEAEEAMRQEAAGQLPAAKRAQAEAAAAAAHAPPRLSLLDEPASYVEAPEELPRQQEQAKKKRPMPREPSHQWFFRTS